MPQQKDTRFAHSIEKELINSRLDGLRIALLVLQKRKLKLRGLSKQMDSGRLRSLRNSREKRTESCS